MLLSRVRDTTSLDGVYRRTGLNRLVRHLLDQYEGSFGYQGSSLVYICASHVVWVDGLRSSGRMYKSASCPITRDLGRATRRTTAVEVVNRQKKRRKQ